MSNKERLGKFHSKVFKGFSPDELRTFGVKDKGEGKFIRKTPSFDGETFDEFLRQAEMPRDTDPGDSGRPSRGREYLLNSKFYKDNPDFKYNYFDDPKKAKLLDTFTQAGIPQEEMIGLAREAGIKNLNKPKEARQMLQVYLDRQGIGASKTDEKDERPNRNPPNYIQDPNRDIPAVSSETSAAQARLDKPLASLYNEQESFGNNPVQPAQFRDDYIKRNFMSKEKRAKPNKMLAMYNAMNEVA